VNGQSARLANPVSAFSADAEVTPHNLRCQLVLALPLMGDLSQRVVFVNGNQYQ